MSSTALVLGRFFLWSLCWLCATWWVWTCFKSDSNTKVLPSRSSVLSGYRALQGLVRFVSDIRLPYLFSARWGSYTAFTTDFIWLPGGIRSPAPQAHITVLLLSCFSRSFWSDVMCLCVIRALLLPVEHCCKSFGSSISSGFGYSLTQSHDFILHAEPSPTRSSV